MTNKDRAERAANAIVNYNARGGKENIEDLLTDMMHYCNQNDINFEESLRMANIHFDVEKEGDGAFIWLQDGEMEGAANCGCVLKYIDNQPAFFMCENHKQGFNKMVHIIHSSHGDIEIDDKGQILSVSKTCDCPENDHCFVFGLDVDNDRFDVEEYVKTYGKLDREIDILDIGYFDAGIYTPPDARWRKEIKQELLKGENSWPRER